MLLKLLGIQHLLDLLFDEGWLGLWETEAIGFADEDPVASSEH